MRNVKTRRKLAFGLFTALVVGTVAGLVGSNREVVETKAANTYTWNAESGDQNKLGNASGNAKLGDITWAYTRGNANYEGWANPNIQLGSKAQPAGTTVLTGSLPAIYGDAISQVSVTTMGYGTEWRLTIKIGGTTYVNAATVSTNPTLGTITTGTISDGATGDIEITWSNGSRAIYLNKIEIVGLDLAPPAEFGELASVAIENPANKLTFTVGETFSSEGLELKLGDDSDPIVYQYTTTGFTTDLDDVVFDSSDIGSKVVTVSYEGFTLTYNINIIEAPKHVTKTIVTSELGIGNAEDVPVIEVDDNWTIELSKGTGSTMAKYYTSGTAIRFYGGNNLLIKPLEGNSDYYITKVTITNSGAGPIAVSTGNNLDSLTPVVEPKWVGSKYTLENIDGYRYFSFDHVATSGNIRIAEIEITYEENPAYNSAKEFADWIMGHEGGDITTVDCEDKFLEAMIMWDDLSAGAQDSFMTHADFADAVARIRMWAAANDYDWDVDFVGDSGSHLQITTVTNSPEKALQGVLIIGVFGLTTLMGYYFLRKRRVI